MISRRLVSLVSLLVFGLLATACPEEGPGDPVTAIADCGNVEVADELETLLSVLVEEHRIDSPDYRFGEVLCAPPSSSFSIELVQFALVPLDDTTLVDAVNDLKGLDSLKLTLETTACNDTWGFFAAADSRGLDIGPVAKAIEASDKLEMAIGC